MTVLERTRLSLALLLVVGGGAVLFAGYGLLGVVQSLGARAPVLALDAIDGAALMAGLALLTLATLYLLPRPEAGPRRRRSANGAGGPDLGPLIMMIAGGCMILCPLAPSIVRAAVGATAEGRGYVRCPHLSWPRRQPDRWALPTPTRAQARCPIVRPPP